MRVLLIEDEQRLAEIVGADLRAEGMEVDVEHAGDTGLWRATEGSFDAIVLDIMLPVINGYEVCRRLREAGVWTPVLMLTAKDGEYDEAEALDTGADDFLRKPFSLVVLVARLRALVRRGATARPAVLTTGSVTLDPASGEVHVGEREVGLTPREFRVLELLMRNPDTPVAASRILDHVWGIDADLTSNVVPVNVAAIRRKLGAAGATPIRTVRGFGYRMDAE
jgi:DNA-binding response OmpR family regulator